MRFLYVCLPLLLSLAACATLSEEECRAGNWYGIGKEDGAAGRSANFLGQHAKACQDFGIAPDRKAWSAGRRDGLEVYCTPSRAFQEGRRGRELSPVCPTSKVALLERENTRGLALHRVEREIKEVEREIRDINIALAGLEAGHPSRTALVSERSFLRLDLLTLRAERARYR